MATKTYHAATGKTVQDVDYTYYTGRTVCDLVLGQSGRHAMAGRVQKAWSDHVTCTACRLALGMALGAAFPAQTEPALPSMRWPVTFTRRDGTVVQARTEG